MSDATGGGTEVTVAMYRGSDPAPTWWFGPINRMVAHGAGERALAVMGICR